MFHAAPLSEISLSLPGPAFFQLLTALRCDHRGRNKQPQEGRMTTSKKDASKASKLLRTSKSATVKSVAGSDLAGRKGSGKKK
jgi:hypothetical protein